MPFVGGVFTPYFRTPPGPTPPVRRGLVRPPVNLVANPEEEVTRVTPAGEPLVPTSGGTVQASFNNAGWIAAAPSGRVLVCFAYGAGKLRSLAVWTRTRTGGWEDLSAAIAANGYVGAGPVGSPTVRAVPGRDESFGLAFTLGGDLAYRELRFSRGAYGLDAAWDHAAFGTTFDHPSLGHDKGGVAWVAAGATDRAGVQSIQLVRGDGRGVVRAEVTRGKPAPSLPALAIGASVGVVVWRELDVDRPAPQSDSYTTVAASFALPTRGAPRGFTLQPLAGYRIDPLTSAWDPGSASVGGDRFIAAWQHTAPRGTALIWNAGTLNGLTWTAPVDVCDTRHRPQNRFPHVAADGASGIASIVWEGEGGGPKLASAAAVRLSSARATTLSLPDQYLSARGDNGLADDDPLAPAVLGRLPDATWPTVCVANDRLYLAWFARPAGRECTLRYREATW